MYTIYRADKQIPVYANITAAQAMHFLHLTSEQTLKEKAYHGELIRRTWKVVSDEPVQTHEPEEPIKRAGLPHGYTPSEWREWCRQWNRARRRVREACTC